MFTSADIGRAGHYILDLKSSAVREAYVGSRVQWSDPYLQILPQVSGLFRLIRIARAWAWVYEVTLPVAGVPEAYEHLDGQVLSWLLNQDTLGASNNSFMAARGLSRIVAWRDSRESKRICSVILHVDALSSMVVWKFDLPYSLHKALHLRWYSETPKRVYEYKHASCPPYSLEVFNGPAHWCISSTHALWLMSSQALTLDQKARSWSIAES